MKTIVTLDTFRRAFADCGRGDQFSYEALGLLFDYFEQYEQDTGEEIELDVIAICCEFEESAPDAIASSYDFDLSGVCEDEVPQAVMDFLCDQTTVCGVTDSGAIVYQQF